MTPMAIVVTKVELKSVMDASGMAACIEAGAFGADEVVAVIGKTEGNGGVNDFTRILADQAFRGVLKRRGTRRGADIGSFPWVGGGGGEGVTPPHARLFPRTAKPAPPPPPRIETAPAMSAELLPEDIGRPAMVEKVA